MGIKLSTISNGKGAKIQVAGWALSIWLIIYILIAIFVVYQALPNSKVPKRNNFLIFGKIKYLFALNMVLNGVWLPVFMLNTRTGFVIATIIIALLDVTCLWIMMLASRAKLDDIEMACTRVVFSMYSGWVTAATILNITGTAQEYGKVDPNIDWSEVTWGIIIIFVALFIYILAAYRERNPLFGGLYIWVLLAIWSKSSDQGIHISCIISLVILIISLAGITRLSLKEKMEDKLTHGLFY